MYHKVNYSNFIKSLEEQLKAKAEEISTIKSTIANIRKLFVGSDPKDYSRCGISEAILKYLEESNEPRTTREITEFLKSHKVYSKSNNLYNNINATLHRLNIVERTVNGWIIKGKTYGEEYRGQQ